LRSLKGITVQYLHIFTTPEFYTVHWNLHRFLLSANSTQIYLNPGIFYSLDLSQFCHYIGLIISITRFYIKFA